MTKNRWTLLPWKQLDKVVSVLTFGAAKHPGEGIGNKGDEKEYIDAALRHIAEHLQGVTGDHETGEPPLAHAVADLLIAMDLVQPPGAAMFTIESKRPELVATGETSKESFRVSDAEIRSMSPEDRVDVYEFAKQRSEEIIKGVNPTDVLPRDTYDPISEPPELTYVTSTTRRVNR